MAGRYGVLTPSGNVRGDSFWGAGMGAGSGENWRRELAGGLGGGETARTTKRGFDAQLPMVKSAEPSGVGISAFRRPNGSIARLPSGVLLNLITSLSESRNGSRPGKGTMIELRRPLLTVSVILKNVPRGFSFRANVNCFRSTRTSTLWRCVSTSSSWGLRLIGREASF